MWRDLLHSCIGVTGPDAVLNSTPLPAELHGGHKEAQVTTGELPHSSESGGAQMRKESTWAGGQNSGQTWKDNLKEFSVK